MWDVTKIESVDFQELLQAHSYRHIVWVLPPDHLV